MQAALRATWASAVANHRARKNKEIGDSVTARLERIRARWAADVRVDTGHYKGEVESAPIQLTAGGTSGYIQIPDEPYFYFNEYGTARMSARPSMRQAVAAEKADFLAEIDRIINGG